MSDERPNDPPPTHGPAGGSPRARIPAIGPETRGVAVLMPTWLGDIVMATASLHRLRRVVPEARITALVPPGMDSVLEGCGALDAVVAIQGKGVAGPVRTAAAIRRTGADTVVLLPNSPRSAIAAALSGRRIRVGTPRGGRGMLLSHRVPPPPKVAAGSPVPAVVHYDRIIAFALGQEPWPLEGPDADRLRPTLVARESDRVAAREVLGPLADHPTLLLVPGGNRENKRWPGERFATVARSLRETHGLLPVITGSPGERTLCAAIAAAVGPQVVDAAAAGGGLAAVKGLVAAARLVLSNDTGPRHLAAGLGTPTVALFGPTDHRWTSLPGVPESILLAEPFLPETLVADRHAALCRIDRIPVSDVLHAAAARLAAATPASPAPPVPGPIA